MYIKNLQPHVSVCYRVLEVAYTSNIINTIKSDLTNITKLAAGIKQHSIKPAASNLQNFSRTLTSEASEALSGREKQTNNSFLKAQEHEFITT